MEGIVAVVVGSAGANSKGCGNSEEASLHFEEGRKYEEVEVDIRMELLSLHGTPRKKRMPAE